ncbi:NAD(+) kinase [Methanocella sp. CWC-04]|uniref:NAD kinase n=1 Tax=Methanooceanicella nereidis TaxID=2052831 RepID=A0AAP2W7R9_9EURY|nr:NAD(+)/NADH kinase [Methanocella sp. CWC-04]MCD1295499.1 NAD(+) kinase [Methanocella sp. CWC-04]
MKANSVGIITRLDVKDPKNIISSFVKHLSFKVKIFVDPVTAAMTGIKDVTEVDEMYADLILIFGGDGTILRTLQLLPKPTPILGINMGEVGFLTVVDPESAFYMIDDIIENFEIVERSRLAVKLNEFELPSAMNEAVIITSRPAKISRFRIYIDDKLMEDIRADGVVIATPTGSTAYAMSAGGPIVDPRVNAFIIVPLAPYKLSARPWVVPASSEIRLELLREEKESMVVIDGQYTANITKNDVLTFTKCESPAIFVKFGDKFYDLVREKLT